MLDDYTDEFVPEIGGISLREYENIVNEIENQPSWRAIADQDMDYADGKQLDSDLLRRQKELGIPPLLKIVSHPRLGRYPAMRQ